MRPHSRLALMICLAFMLGACNFDSQAVFTALGAAQNPLPTAWPSAPADGCPVTTAQDPPFTPPPPYLDREPYGIWYGTADLWTVIPVNGVWDRLPLNRDGYTQKIVWWRDGFNWRDEPEPELMASGERIDAPAPPLITSRATAVFEQNMGSAIMVGVDFPTPGCWEITAYYRNTTLTFVVWVAP